MAQHPLNLALRFLLELAALGSIGIFGWQLTDNAWRIAGVVVLPLLVAMVWATFAVPKDPSRSGNAPIPVSGSLRLFLELAIFGLAVWALHATGAVGWSWTLASLVIVHYLLSYDRIAWLLQSE